MSVNFDIYQLCTSNIDHYAQYSVASINHYAELHGYQLHVERSKLVEDMHINWSKIEMLSRALEKSKADWVVLFDADIVLAHPEIPLTFFLEGVKADVHILMPQDTPFFRPNRPNAGFILLRNSKESKAIINKWLEASRNEGSHVADIHPRNQRVYWGYVMPKFRHNQQLISRSYFSKYHWFSKLIGQGKFSFHVTQTKTNERSEIMNSLLEKAGARSSLVNVNSLLDSQKEGLLKVC